MSSAISRLGNYASSPARFDELAEV